MSDTLPAKKETRVGRYAWSRAVLHWLLAIVIVLMLANGLKGVAPLNDTDPTKLDVLRMHVRIGMATLTIFACYVLSVLFTRSPPNASSGSRVLDGLAKLAHVALRLGVLVMLASGIATVQTAGLAELLFAANTGNGNLPPNISSFPPAQVHAWTARFMLSLVALHIFGALYHQLLLRDSLLGRMAIWPRRRQG